MVTVNAAFGALLSTTLDEYSNELTDNVFEGFVLTNALNKAGKVTAEGGVSLVEQVQVKKNETVGWFTDKQTVTEATTLETRVTKPTDTDGSTNQGDPTALQFDWAQMEGTIAYNAMEVTKNRGRAALLKMVQGRIDTFEESMKDLLERTLLGGQAGKVSSTNYWFADTKAPQGLRNILTRLTPPAASGTKDNGELNEYGGVWRSKGDTAADTNWLQPLYVKSGAAGTAVNMDLIQEVITKLDRGGSDSSDMVITSAKQWRALEKTLRGSKQFHDTQWASAGFRNFEVAEIPCFYVSDGYVKDDASASDALAGTPWDGNWAAVLNTKYIKFVKHQTDWMENYGFQQVNMAPVWQALIRSVCSFYSTGRRYQGLIDGNTA